MVKKKNIIIVFSLMLLILIVYGYDRTIKPQKTKLLAVDFVPTELYFEQSLSSSIHDKEIKNRFHNLIKDKWGMKKSSLAYQEMVSKAVISFDYGYKGQNLHIDSDGRIMYLVRKSDIGKQSKLKWFCYNINAIYDSTYFVGYITEMDKDVVKVINEIMEIHE